MSLIQPSGGPTLRGLKVPEEFYWVLNDPAPLAGMKYPSDGIPWTELWGNGFRGIVSLHPGPYDPASLSLLFAELLEDLAHGKQPQRPSHETSMVRKAVTVIVESLQKKNGVIVHCIGGRGRTGTVLGCVLRDLGYSPPAIVRYLDKLHKARGKSGWPESEWQADLVRRWPITAPVAGDN